MVWGEKDSLRWKIVHGEGLLYCKEEYDVKESAILWVNIAQRLQGQWSPWAISKCEEHISAQVRQS